MVETEQKYLGDMVDSFDDIGKDGTFEYFQLDGHSVGMNHIEVGIEEDIRSEDKDHTVFYTVQQEMSHNGEQTEGIHSLD